MENHAPGRRQVRSLDLPATGCPKTVRLWFLVFLAFVEDTKAVETRFLVLHRYVRQSPTGTYILRLGG